MMYIAYPQPISATFINSPYFRSIDFFCLIYVFLLPPYFDHDAFMLYMYWKPLVLIAVVVGLHLRNRTPLVRRQDEMDCPDHRCLYSSVSSFTLMRPCSDLIPLN